MNIISAFTDAKLMVDRTVTVPTSRKNVWKVLQYPKLAAEWLPSVKKVISIDTTNADKNGVGTKRTVMYGIKEPIQETVVYAEENAVLAYQVAFPSMVKDHLTVIRLTDTGVNSCTIQLTAYFTPISFTGYLMKHGVYYLLVGASLKSIKQLCTTLESVSNT